MQASHGKDHRLTRLDSIKNSVIDLCGQNKVQGNLRHIAKCSIYALNEQLLIRENIPMLKKNYNEYALGEKVEQLRTII